jgi:hypothetical protein
MSPQFAAGKFLCQSAAINSNKWFILACTGSMNGAGDIFFTEPLSP